MTRPQIGSLGGSSCGTSENQWISCSPIHVLLLLALVGFVLILAQGVMDIFNMGFGMKLAHGPTSHAGRVRVHARGKEHWICGQDFNEKMATAICIFMQYEGVLSFSADPITYHPRDLPMLHLVCSENFETVYECSFPESLCEPNRTAVEVNCNPLRLSSPLVKLT